MAVSFQISVLKCEGDLAANATIETPSDRPVSTKCWVPLSQM
ncbi:hypothetical protein [Marivita hallyeonensis]|nr:hypothetical protein [Marivita hallyeonensis]